MVKEKCVCRDGWRDGLYGGVSERLERGMGGAYGGMGGQLDGKMAVVIDGRMNGGMAGKVGGWRDGGMCGRMNIGMA